MCRLVMSAVVATAITAVPAWGQPGVGPWENWEHGKGPLALPLQPEFEKLVNRPSCVFGHCTNLDQAWPDPIVAVTPSACFYFGGDSKALNEFLQAFSRLKDEKLLLIIHPGRAPKESRRGSREEFTYDWKMVWDGQLRKRGEGDHLEHFARSVEVWLGGNVKLDELRVSTEIEVKSGGEIEKFIAEHEARRKKAGEHTIHLENVEFSYTRVPHQYARAMARVVATARRAAVEKFGLDMPPKLAVAVRIAPEALKGGGAYTGTDCRSSIWLTLESMNDLSKPSQGSGVCPIYVLCEQIAILAMHRAIPPQPEWMTEAGESGWDMYIGARLVDEVYACEGEKLWPEPYDYREYGMKQFRKMLENQGGQTEPAACWEELAKIVGDKGLGPILRAWPKAVIGSADPGEALGKALMTTAPDKQISEWWKRAAKKLVRESS